MPDQKSLLDSLLHATDEVLQHTMWPEADRYHGRLDHPRYLALGAAYTEFGLSEPPEQPHPDQIATDDRKLAGLLHAVYGIMRYSLWNHDSMYIPHTRHLALRRARNAYNQVQP